MTTRRAILTTAAALAVGATVPLARSATANETGAARPTIPRTLARRSGRVATGTRVTRTPFRMTHLAVSWEGPGAPGVRVRTAGGWGDWERAHACHAGRDGGPTTARTALLTVPEATGYEVQAANPAATVSVTELNTVDGPSIGTAAAPGVLRLAGRDTSLRYLSRAGWGADESLRLNPDGSENWPPEYFPVQALTVHHTAGQNADPDPAATVRAIYYYQAVTQSWGDIGYHLLIDEAGTVYEGRWSGADPVPAFGGAPGADGRAQLVDGGHVRGYNTGNVGVVLLGDFTSQLPTRAARETLTVVLSVLAGVQRLDPLGTVAYTNPTNGNTATADVISGHRDWAATECPGNLFYPELPAVRQAVAQRLRRR